MLFQPAVVVWGHSSGQVEEDSIIRLVNDDVEADLVLLGVALLGVDIALDVDGLIDEFETGFSLEVDDFTDELESGFVLEVDGFTDEVEIGFSLEVDGFTDEEVELFARVNGELDADLVLLALEDLTEALDVLTGMVEL
ncbi:hypothetical protein Tdes44962_MAKER02882 [Teratosphaeria destructans]|uniref:Uncharacterized protein n=1 Tax=Teratosphaeria destructans TaxID=418781 RepID=A0A9W7SRM1_9PEZI|nr:hypothetical protein Tdes44962_MAKER02882 [Teratosphaeria destructans]